MEPEPVSVPCRQGAARRVAARGPLVFFCAQIARRWTGRIRRSARADEKREFTMFQFLAMTQAGCRRSFPRHLLHRITTLAIMALAALIAQVIYTQPVNAESSDRPNIVLIMADDLGWSDLACYGSDLHETPNLDRFAQQGVRFTNAYAASPVCCPTRASILTGRFPARLHMTIWRESAGKPRAAQAVGADCAGTCLWKKKR